MCGRFNVIDDPITQSIMDILGIKFDIKTNDNVCPSELVSTLSFEQGQVTQIKANWGIKPDWANKLLINAQSETVSNKKTFKQAFLNHRCLIPISGWYEWKSDNQGKKQKYLFSNQSNALFMAAIMFPKANEADANVMLDLFGETPEQKKPTNQFVSLTTKANTLCEPIHSRVPLIIHNDDLHDWLADDAEKAAALLHSELHEVNIRKVD